MDSTVEMDPLDFVRGLVDLFGKDAKIGVESLTGVEGTSVYASGPLPVEICRLIERKYRPKGPRLASVPYPVFDCARRSVSFADDLAWIVGKPPSRVRFYRVDLAQLATLIRLSAEAQP
jgi:hypothetical protein